MEKNPFFKFIWRINGLLIFTFVLFALLLLLTDTLSGFKLGSAQEKPPVQSNTVDHPAIDKQKLFIRKKIISNNLIYLSVSKPGKNGSSLSYSRDMIMNAGIHSLETNSTSWFFSTNHQQIEYVEHFHKLEVTATGETNKIILGHLVSSLTTDQLGNLQREIWVTDMNGADPQKIITDAKGEPYLWRLKNNQYKIAFNSASGVKLISFDPFTREIGRTTHIEVP